MNAILVLLFLVGAIVLSVSGEENQHCKSIVAYYYGNLTNEWYSGESHNVQFRLHLRADQEKQEIRGLVDKWNEDVSSSQDFKLRVLYGGDISQSSEIYEESISPFVKRTNNNFDLFLVSGTHNYYRLLNFKHFNNSFTLTNPFGSCSRHQLDGRSDPWNPDLNQLQYCVCCGDEYEPINWSGCPNDNWIHSGNELSTKLSTKSSTTKLTTQKPTTTTKLTTTTEKSENEETCQSIVAYVVGKLKNKHTTADIYDVQFQLKLHADQETKRVHVEANKWNEEYTKSGDIKMVFFYYGEDGKEHERTWCDIYDKNCTSSFVENGEGRGFKLGLIAENHNYYPLLSFNQFNDSFGLTNSTNGCSKNQLDQGDNGEWTLISDELTACVCCDKYEPKELLGCPCNKWSKK